jgi:hypothetical protein
MAAHPTATTAFEAGAMCITPSRQEMYRQDGIEAALQVRLLSVSSAFALAAASEL